jgi:hypothetical protein
MTKKWSYNDTDVVSGEWIIDEFGAFDGMRVFRGKVLVKNFAPMPLCS